MSNINKLVFVEAQLAKSEPFTTSEIIAEHTSIKHHAVKQIILRHEEDLKEFGILAFDVPKLTGVGRPKTNYRLNEPQATLVITYLQNTEPVRAFKKELVRQFFLMREELSKKQLARIEYKPIRRELTDAIQERAPGNVWAFKQFTDLAYKKALGKTAAQIRNERGAASNSPAVEFLTSSELDSVTKATNSIVVLLDMGLDYREIKEILLTRR